MSRRRQPDLGVGVSVDVRLLLPALGAWAVAAALASAPVPVRVGAVVIALIVAGVGLLGSSTRWRSVSLGASAAVVLLAAQLGWGPTEPDTRLIEATADRAVVTVRAVLDEDPRAATPGLGSAERWSARARVSETQVRGARLTDRLVVVIQGGSDLRECPWRAPVVVTGRLRHTALSAPVVAEVDAMRTQCLADEVPWWVTLSNHVRAALRASVVSAGADARGLVPSLVLGDTSTMPPDLRAAMRVSGLAHLSAVSGANVTIVVSMVMALARLVGARRRTRVVVGLLAIVAFVIAARPEASVVRAAVMGAVGVVALSSSHRARAAPALGVSVLAVCAVDPPMVRSVGFALSALATGALVLVGEEWTRALRERLPGVTTLLAAPLAVTAAASLATLPVLVVIGADVPVYTVAANVAAAPLVPLATIAGVAAALVTLLSPVVGSAAGIVAAAAAWGIAQVARLVASIPGAALPWPDGPIGASLAVAAGVVLALFSRALVKTLAARWRVVVLGGALALAAVRLTAPPGPAPPPGDWALIVCDVGQGDAILLRSGAQEAVVVDTGPDPAALARCLRWASVQRVAALFITHYHRDHVGGTAALTADWPPGEVVATAVREPLDGFELVNHLAAGVPRREAQPGEVYAYGWVRIEVWGPARRFSAGSVPNNASLVLAATGSGVRSLLLGDIEREAAADLRRRLQSRPTLREWVESADVLKAPHHGSANIDTGLLETVAPPVALISVGKDNPFGHPSVLQQQVLRAAGSRVLRTDTAGSIAVSAPATSGTVNVFISGPQE